MFVSSLEMRLLSLLTFASLSLMVVVSTLLYSQHPSGGQFDLGLNEPVVEGHLHPATLPLIAVSGGTLYAQGAASVVAAPSEPSTRAVPSNLARLSTHPNRLGGSLAHRFQQRHPEPEPPVVVALPLPLPAPGPPPKGRPKPCFKDC
jgi:hypothetical protein